MLGKMLSNLKPISFFNLPVLKADTKRVIFVKLKTKHFFSTNIIYISSANDSHTLPSRHMQQKAVDISRINGTKMSVGYPSMSSVKKIVDAIQDTFEGFDGRRENFGPHLKKKLGEDYTILGHNDHIHISVD